jgi:Txe/YoeB family toxin of Txe-Axe toxin-antitoxin module
MYVYQHTHSHTHSYSPSHPLTHYLLTVSHSLTHSTTTNTPYALNQTTHTHSHAHTLINYTTTHTHTGKISPNDLTVHTDVEIASTWSRRVHALERISDQVPVLNKYPAYSPFTLKSQLRYLFQTYPSVRGKTIFRSKDRLFLTKSIIVGYFDMGIFQEEGIITDILALHDANRGDKLTVGTM